MWYDNNNIWCSKITRIGLEKIPIGPPSKNVIYCNAENNRIYRWSGSGWQQVGSGGGSGTGTQADWNQTDTMASDYIRNKPTIPEIPKNVSSFVNDAEYTTIEYNSSNERLDINVNPNGLSQ